MSFNKRYLNEKSIRVVYEDGGYEKLVDYITKPDSLVTMDKFSNKVVDLIIEGDTELQIKTLIN